MGSDKKKRKRRRHSGSRKRRGRNDESDSESDFSSSDESDSSESEESSSESDSSESSPDQSRKAHSSKRKKKHRHSSSSVRGRKEKRKKRKEKTKGTKSRKIDPISERDYYLKSSEFRAWLADEKGIFFSDLSSEQSRKLFNNKFVARWNGGKLKKKYYDGIESSALGHSTQTKYQWKLTSESGTRRSTGGSVSDQVASWTAGGGEDDKPQRVLGPSPKPAGDGAGGRSRSSEKPIGPFLPTTVPDRDPDPFAAEERRQEEVQRVRTERKEWRKHHEMVMDELLPKATGREARIEKKKIRAEQRRHRDTSPDMSESSLMGPSRSVQDRIQAIQAERHSRAQKAAQKVEDYRAKESARVQAILEMAKANKKEGSLWS